MICVGVVKVVSTEVRVVRTGVCFEGTASRICWLMGYKAWANGEIKDAAKVFVVSSRTVASS